MTDIVRLLPDAIANQIAAGEVIQRPASVVKELVENAVDAGSTEIQVIIKSAGKTLIKVVDNGSGMSEGDVRMSLERHATSKLRESADLFNIQSMGFRGEALPSIVAIAQVQIKTRPANAEWGTELVVHASKVKAQEACQCAPGTSIEVKNLFYNVPARRKFLKSDVVEFRHISDEFGRVALAHPEIAMTLHHNEQEVYRLYAGTTRQRVVQVLGKKFNDKLVPVAEETSYVSIKGFTGKPETARKTRGDQYLFVNRRFIRSPYLDHAIRASFEGMIEQASYPTYVLFLKIEPAKIDVNVHPTKQQVKFEDERLIYNYLRVSVRHALGKYSITPSLDFEQPTLLSGGGIRHGGSRDALQNKRDRDNIAKWQHLFEGLDMEKPDATGTVTFQSEVFTSDDDHTDTSESAAPFQLHNSYLISQIKSGILVIDQQSAHERILYERYLSRTAESPGEVQKLMFPTTVEFKAAEAALLLESLSHINEMGFEVEHFGQNTFVIHGAPAEMEEGHEERLLRRVVDQLVEEIDVKTGVRERIAHGLAMSAAKKRGTRIPQEERQILIDILFACENPYTSPTGRKCFVIIELEELMTRFNKN